MDNHIFQLLIQQATDAARRTRIVLMVATVASVAQLSAAYNFAFGFLRDFSQHMILRDTSSGKQNLMLDELQKATIRSWIDQLSVNVNILGIKFSVADASLVGSLALFIICIWLFYSSRRENHIIGKTCQLAFSSSKEVKARVFYGLCNIQLFGSVSNNDQPFISIASNSFEKSSVVKYLIFLLFYLPAITVFLMIAVDILSVFHLKALFRGSADTVYSYMSSNIVAGTSPSVTLWDQVASKFYLTVFVEFLFAIFLTHIIRSAARFQSGTITLLRELESMGWGQFQETPEEE